MVSHACHGNNMPRTLRFSNGYKRPQAEVYGFDWGNGMMGRSNLYLLVALLGAGGVAPAAGAPLKPSLCSADERVYFSCQADKGAKRIALCGQVKGSPDGVRGFLQYRFGTREHPDLVYPSSRNESLEKFTYGGANQKLGRMESREVSFHSGSFDYTVYTMSYPLGDAESDGYGHESGVRVARDGKDVATVKCGSEPEGTLWDLGWLQ
jgi:hypothetical protein